MSKPWSPAGTIFRDGWASSSVRSANNRSSSVHADRRDPRRHRHHGKTASWNHKRPHHRRPAQDDRRRRAHHLRPSMPPSFGRKAPEPHRPVRAALHDRHRCPPPLPQWPRAIAAAGAKAHARDQKSSKVSNIQAPMNHQSFKSRHRPVRDLMFCCFIGAWMFGSLELLGVRPLLTPLCQQSAAYSSP